MIKGYALIPKRPDISLEQFHSHWRGVHADLACRIKALRRYVQSHRIPQDIPGVPHSPYEGAAEIWFDDLETGRGLGDNPDYVNGAYADEPNFIAEEGPSFLMTRENVVVPGPPLSKDATGVKSLFLLKRKPGLSVADFQKHWREVHAPIVPKTPGLRRYVQCHVAPETYESDTPPVFDGVAELDWASMADFERGWNSDEMQVEQIQGDVPNFIDLENTVGLLVEEARIIWP